MEISNEKLKTKFHIGRIPCADSIAIRSLCLQVKDLLFLSFPTKDRRALISMMMGVLDNSNVPRKKRKEKKKREITQMVRSEPSSLDYLAERLDIGINSSWTLI